MKPYLKFPSPEEWEEEMKNNNWSPRFCETDENGFLLYGKFKTCTTCNRRLCSQTEDDEEHLAYHGYCSRECASDDGYGNYQV